MGHLGGVSSQDTVLLPLRHDLKDRDSKLHKLGSELRSRAGEVERLQKIVGQHQRAQDRLRQEAEYRMFTLRVRTTPTSAPA